MANFLAICRQIYSAFKAIFFTKQTGKNKRHIYYRGEFFIHFSPNLHSSHDHFCKKRLRERGKFARKFERDKI